MLNMVGHVGIVFNNVVTWGEPTVPSTSRSSQRVVS